MSYCCEKFAEQAGALQAMTGGGFGYPPEVRPKAQFGLDEDGKWHIHGCCGGGCAVVSGMLYCPYCGTLLNEA